MVSHWGGLGLAGALSLFANLLLLALIVVAVVLVVRSVSRPGASGGPTSAQQILAERFARGEIDATEYQERLRVLRGEPPSPPPAS